MQCGVVAQHQQLEALRSSSPASERVRVADAIVSLLVEAGVDTFFGIPGGAIAPIYDALGRNKNCRVIVARHETGAAFMAAGFARTTGRLPALLLTSGPGITNALTGLASAYADGIPMIVLGGEVPRANFGRGALQEGSRYQLDVLGMARTVTKTALEITSAQGALGQLRRAIATATSGRRGPVFVSLPLDLAKDTIQPGRISAHVSTQFVTDPELIAASARKLEGARRGLIVAGSGARTAQADIIALAEKLQMPVCTTPKAKGLFPEDHPLSLGVFGYGGHESAKAYMGAGVDVLLCVGCGLGETATNNWSKGFGATDTFIQIDIDGAQIGRNYPVDIGLVGPAQVIVESLTEAVVATPVPALDLGGPTFVDAAMAVADTVPLKTPRVLRLLQEQVPSGAVYTSDIGEHLLFTLHYLEVGTGDEFMAGIGLGSMGSGIGAAIGAKMAAPRRPVVSISGDFGFTMFGLAELATCVQEKVGVVFVVLNDASMRMVEAGFASLYGAVPAAFASPRSDFAAMARAAGAVGYTIHRAEDFLALPRGLFDGDVPVVLDVQIDPTLRFGNNLRVEQISNFSLPAEMQSRRSNGPSVPPGTGSIPPGGHATISLPPPGSATVSLPPTSSNGPPRPRPTPVPDLDLPVARPRKP